MVRIGIVLTFLLLLVVPYPIRATHPIEFNKMGVHLLLDDGRHQWDRSLWDSHLSYAHELVGDWGYVTQLIRLDDLDVEKWQYFLDLCEKHTLIPIIRLATTFDREHNWWRTPPQDSDGAYQSVAAQYADFIAALDWDIFQPLLVIGNEPNRGDEWGGQPNPAEYARFLKDMATALHEAHPFAEVMNAGLDHFAPNTNGQPFINGMIYVDGESFMDAMIEAEPGVFGYIDAWASHPYPLGAFIAPPWEQTFKVDWLNGSTNPRHETPPEGILNRGINAYEWELWKLSTYGIEDLPVYITETGWRHSIEGYPSPEQVVWYTNLTMSGGFGEFLHLNDDNRVIGVTFFALNGHPDEWSHTNWLDMNPDGTVNGVLIRPDKFKPVE
ncbi:MAG: hypothetical protein L0154_01655 [Chloroflexi bacterium]|nr:hypothetical protein [Chloroflexota bacterium]